MKFTTLSSGSHGNAYLLETEGGSLLIEAGLPFKKLQQEMWKRGKNLSGLSGCLISHAHGDHAKSAKQVEALGVPTYMSVRCAQALGAGATWVFTRAPCPLEPVRILPFVVTPFSMKHDVDDGVFGFIVDSYDGGRLCYISDARFTEYKVPGVTIWAIEANYDPEILRRNVAKGNLEPIVAERVIQSHMSIDTAIDALKANDLSRCEQIVLCHLSDGNSDAADFIRRVESQFGIPCSVAGW